MEAQLTHEAAAATKVPWNKGKMIGSKPPLRIKNVWSIRTKLQVDGRVRDLAMFNLAIDSNADFVPFTTLGCGTTSRMEVIGAGRLYCFYAD